MAPRTQAPINKASVSLSGAGQSIVVALAGSWSLHQPRPRATDFLEEIDPGRYREIRFDSRELAGWDTSLLVFVRALQGEAVNKGLACQLDGLPTGALNLLRLSQAVASAEGTRRNAPEGWLTRVGERSLASLGGLERYAVFLGQLLLDAWSLFRGRAQLRRQDFIVILQNTGPGALPIVGLLSFLTGLIIAFIGVIQLQKFAADIYVADLVGLATTRELGAVMAGVIMAGRTGAAFAAQIGSMRVNEEVDALTTFGISPMQFLVLPRVLALILMMPLLCGFANLIAILGGMVVAVGISDVTVTQYVLQIDRAVGTSDLFVGLFKSAVFGFIIALAGCYRGLHCGKDATAVGLAATSAVVTGITWIVVADAVFAVLFHIVGI